MRLTHRKLLKNLGIVFDENFNFRTHIKNVCKLLLSHPRPAQNHKTFELRPSHASAWRLPLFLVGLTTATPCCMVSQLRTCSSSRECLTVLPGWSPGLVALHLAPPPSSFSPLVTHFLQNSVQNAHFNLQEPLFW